MTGSGLEAAEGYRRRRRTAARRVLLVLVVGVGVQVGGWVIASGHPAVEATAILSATAAMYVVAGLLLPVPPKGFLWPWQRAARERHAAARARRTSPYDGFDRVGLASSLAGVVPWQAFQVWLQGQEVGLPTNLAVLLLVVLVGNGFLWGVLEVRRRLARAAAPGHEQPADSVPPGLVTLQLRTDHDHDHRSETS